MNSGDRRATRPSLDRLLVLAFNGDVDLLQRVMVNERTFFSERAITYLLLLRRDTIMPCVRLLRRVR